MSSAAVRSSAVESVHETSDLTVTLGGSLRASRPSGDLAGDLSDNAGDDTLDENVNVDLGLILGCDLDSGSISRGSDGLGDDIRHSLDNSRVCRSLSLASVDNGSLDSGLDGTLGSLGSNTDCGLDGVDNHKLAGASLAGNAGSVAAETANLGLALVVAVTTTVRTASSTTSMHTAETVEAAGQTTESSGGPSALGGVVKLPHELSELANARVQSSTDGSALDGTNTTVDASLLSTNTTSSRLVDSSA